MGRIWSDGGEDMEWGGCGVMVGRIWSDGGEDVEWSDGGGYGVWSGEDVE